MSVITQIVITCISHVQLHVLQLGHRRPVCPKKVVATFIVLVD